MADRKITELPSATSVGAGDLFVVVQNGITKNINKAVLEASLSVSAGGGGGGVSITGASINGAGNLVLSFSDGSTIDVGHVVGSKGDAGPQGAGLIPDGFGVLNEAKIAAVQAANVRHVFVVNPAGDARSNKTTPAGLNGDQSLNIIAYEPGNGWHTYGQFTGVQGPVGPSGVGITSASVNGSGHLILTKSDATTVDAGLVVGPAGATGGVGATGPGFTSAAVNGAGHLIITKTDGATIDAGFVTGGAGTSGPGYTAAAISNGHLVLTKTDGTTVDVGQVVGAKGDTGNMGATGPAGVGISTAGVDGNGHLILTKTDSSTFDAGVVVGPAGANGQGVPTGGSAGQMLVKNSATNYDTKWATPFDGSWGSLSGKPTVPSVLDDLSDVTAPSPSSGQVLTWNGTIWVPQTPASGGGSSTQTILAWDFSQSIGTSDTMVTGLTFNAAKSSVGSTSTMSSGTFTMPSGYTWLTLYVSVRPGALTAGKVFNFTQYKNNSFSAGTEGCFQFETVFSTGYQSWADHNYVSLPFKMSSGDQLFWKAQNTNAAATAAGTLKIVLS